MSTATQAIAPEAPAHSYGPPVAVVVNVQVKALAFQEVDGRYSVVVPELPGCYSAADTIEEVAANAAEAATGWLAVAHESRRDEATRKIVEPLP